MREIWVASFEYGSANLSRIQVVKETDKTFQIARDSERILGWDFFGVRLLKEKHHCFDTPDEALEFLVDAAQGHILSCRANVAKAITEHEKLGKLRKYLKEGGEGDPDHGEDLPRHND